MSGAKITVANILCEFFEVVVHNILYARKLYPETIFAAKKKYGIAVYQSIHPDVNDYINQSLKAVNFHAKNNHLKRLYVCFHKSEKISEKYVFEVLNISNHVESDPLLVEVEQSLRAFLVKLNTSQNYLEDLPDDSTFSIRLETTAYSRLEFNQEPAFEDFPWVEVNEQDKSIESPDIVPLHMLKCPLLSLQMFVGREVEN
ncbi:hypothetical protein NQ317_011611 [Molorchus minor]|uniref:HORMA domain-containing protein n=1 Tax=Molorchus minor TaxID=1323400 RepID=A0ABQ9J9F7_9CUCU|nr:hypothetical protein NQ317_011611 [Molorchus minor]